MVASGRRRVVCTPGLRRVGGSDDLIRVESAPPLKGFPVEGRVKAGKLSLWGLLGDLREHGKEIGRASRSMKSPSLE